MIFDQSSSRYNCATFGQQFEHTNGSFYDHFPVHCQADQTWSATTIPHKCACKYSKVNWIHISLRVQVCQPTAAGCRSKDDCLLEPRLSSGAQRAHYIQVRCWTTLQQVRFQPGQYHHQLMEKILRAIALTFGRTWNFLNSTRQKHVNSKIFGNKLRIYFDQLLQSVAS